MSQDPTEETPQPEPPFARALPPPPLAQFAPAQPAPPGTLPPPPFAEHAPTVPPVDALAYSLPSTRLGPSRPRAVMVMGWASILVACVGAVVSLGTIVFASMFYLAARDVDRLIAMAPAGPVGPPSFLVMADPSPPKVEVGPDGLADPQRRVAVNGLYSVHPLRPPRMEQLDAILARAGWRVLALDRGAPLGVEAVREAVVDHGQLFGDPNRAPEYFKTAAGRLELYDDRAVFYPEDGSPPVRSTTVSASMPKPLTPEQAQAVLKQVRAAPQGARLNEAQVSGLLAVLGMPNQKLAQASRGLSGEPQAVTIHRDGEATVRFGGGDLHLGTQGQILPAAPAADAPPKPPPAANVAAFASAVVAAVASLALAVVLFVAGVAALRRTGRRSATGKRLHAAWAVLKIPVAAGGAVALCWMLGSVQAALDAVPRGTILGPARAPFNPELVARNAYSPVIVAAVLACVYPMIVFFLLRAKAVRAYFEPAE